MVGIVPPSITYSLSPHDVLCDNAPRVGEAELPPRVEYELTALGETVLPSITALGKWGDDHQDHLRKVITQSARF